MKAMRSLWLALPAIGAMAVPNVIWAQDAGGSQQRVMPSNFRLSTGVTYSNGDYGELEDTEVVAIPVSLTFKKDGLKVRVSVPYVWIDGPGSLLSTPEGRDGGGGQGRGRGGGGSDNSGPGSSNSGSGSSGGSEVEVEDEFENEILDDDDIVDDDGFAGPDNSRSGIGDVNVAVSYVFQLGQSTFLEPGVKVKLPTASRSKRLGTGEVDVTASAALTQDIGSASIYVSGRRKFAGKPEGSTIRSTWGASGGISGKLGDGVYVGADYDWQQSAFVGRQASSEVTGWANFRINRALSVTTYAGTGLNSNSADLFGGATVTARF